MSYQVPSEVLMEDPVYVHVQGPLGLLGDITDHIVGDIRTKVGLKPGAHVLCCAHVCAVRM